MHALRFSDALKIIFIVLVNKWPVFFIFFESAFASRFELVWPNSKGSILPTISYFASERCLDIGWEWFLGCKRFLLGLIVLKVLELKRSGSSWWDQGERLSYNEERGIILFLIILISITPVFDIPFNWRYSSYECLNYFMKLIHLLALVVLAALFNRSQAADKCKRLNFLPMPR